jgi:hypothetical protein
MTPQIDTESDGPSLRERARYRLDNLLARGTVATLISLGIVAGAAVLVSSLLLAIFDVTFAGSQDGGWLEDLWQSTLRVMDPGTMASDVGWGRRLLAMMVTVFGLLVAGTLIGIIANGVEDRVDSMRRGRSAVIESGHLLVVGGTDRLATVVRQLALANRGRSTSTIVVLTQRDPGELHAQVRAQTRGLEGTRVIYRSGDPTRRADLRIVRPGRARGIIVLADGTSDVTAMKTALALTSELGAHQDMPVVVELADSQTAALIAEACPGVEPLVPQAAMARIAAISLRQRGLSQIVHELTDAANSNIHLVDQPETIGHRFGEVVGRFENAIPIGRFGTDAAIELNPPPDHELVEGDRLIVVSGGGELVERSRSADGVRRHTAPSPEPLTIDVPDEHVAVVGWNALGSQLLEGWAVSASPRSTVEIFYDERSEQESEIGVPDLPAPARLTPMYGLADLVHSRRRTTVVVLGGHDPDAAETDARTVAQVRTLQHIYRTISEPPPRLVVELRDPAHAELLDLVGSDDFIVSTMFAGQFAAQLVGQPERRPILLDIYAADGPSLRLVAADRFGLRGTCRFSDIADATYRAGAIAIGWRTSATRGATVVLGPSASTEVSLGPDDQVVMIG